MDRPQRHDLDRRMGQVGRRRRRRPLLWIQGFPERALDTMRRCLESAEQSGHALSLCYALTEGLAQLAVMIRDAPLFRRAFDRVFGEMGPYATHYPQHLRESLETAMTFDQDFLERGAAFAQTTAASTIGRTVRRFPGVLGRVAECLGRAGQVEEGLKIIEAGLARGDATWCIPELLRAKGALVLLREPDAASAAEGLWHDSLTKAGRLGAASWELRTATSIAQFWSVRKRRSEAKDLLAPIYAKFTEGFETGDLRTAKALLDTL